jgi:quercetin dioxygenase-like cupin family protein
MVRVTIQKAEESKWLAVGDATPEDKRWKYSAEELAAQVNIHQMGGPDAPQLLEFRFPPNTFVRPHAHQVAEIMVIASGEMHLGSEVLQPGSSVTIPPGAVYSFRAGPEGVGVLNFRPTSDMTYFTAAEARDRRREQA